MVEETRRRVLASIGGATVVGLAGCASSGDDESTNETNESDDMEGGEATGTASVRAAHLSPDAPDVDVYLDDEKVLSAVPFKTVSDYLDVPAGARSVRITAADDPDTVVFEGDVEVAADTAYTVAAVGELEGEEEFEPLVLEDDRSAPDDDMARVRVLHASPDAPAVDITTAEDGSTLVDGAAYTDTATVEVPAGDYTLQVRPDTESNDGDVVAEFPVTLEGGTAYSAFAAGYLEPESASGDEPFDLVVAVDTEESGETDGTGALRAAHMSPDAPDVDIFVDDEKVLSAVPFKAVSDYLDVPAGARSVRITAAGDPDTVVFEGDVEVAAETSYTVAAIGELEGETEFQALIVEDDRSAPEDDMARVRVIHASPDAPAVDVTTPDGTTVVDGAAFGDDATTEVPAGDYTLQVRPDTESNDGDVVAEFHVTLEGGTGYSAFATGYLNPEEAPAHEPFDLVTVVDTE